MTDSQNEQHDGDQGGDRGPVPYHRFKTINDRYRAALAELEALRQGQQGDSGAGSDKQDKAATVSHEDGDGWRAKYETVKAEADRLKKARLQDRAALAHGIPLDLAGRLAGDTEEAINADAARMAQYVGQRPVVPQIDASTPGQARAAADLRDALHDQTLYDANRDAIFAALKAGRL